MYRGSKPQAAPLLVPIVGPVVTMRFIKYVKENKFNPLPPPLPPSYVDITVAAVGLSSILFILVNRYLQGNELKTIGDGTLNQFKNLQRWWVFLNILV